MKHWKLFLRLPTTDINISEWKTSLTNLQSVGKNKTKLEWVNFMFVSSSALDDSIIAGPAILLPGVTCDPRRWRCWTALSYGKDARILSMSVIDVLGRILRPQYVDIWENYTVKCFTVFKLRYRGNVVRFLTGEGDFLLSKIVLTGCGPHPSSSGWRGSFPRGKAVGSGSDLC
jgi:hypothetical protein